MKIKTLIRAKFYEFIYRIKKVKKRTLYCIGVGILFGVLAFFLNKKSIYIRPYEILRGEYGTQKSPYAIKLDAENLSKNMEFNISVSSRKYTEEEAKEEFHRKLDELKISMLADNEDYEHICGKLNFATDLGDGIKASYAFEPKRQQAARMGEPQIASSSNIFEAIEKTRGSMGDLCEPHIASKSSISTKSNIDDFKYYVTYQGLIDGNGNVKNEDFKVNEYCTGYIEIQLSTDVKNIDGSYKSDKVLFPVKVVSKSLSPIESFKNAFKKAVIVSDSDTLDKDTIELPKIVNDFKIRYKEKIDFTFLLMPLIGILAAILLEARDNEKIKELKKRKQRLLEIDFAQIISKMLLYVNSGMTIRNSMIRMAEQYQAQKLYFAKKNKGNKKKVFENRPAYEELVVVKNKLASGYSETKAYEEMAKNINERTYTRFLNIIIQSIKNGNKELKNILNMEVQDALYERKQHAKKLGEEAATKLVLPLMLMLAVIMVVIMVPAFMGM